MSSLRAVPDVDEPEFEPLACARAAVRRYLRTHPGAAYAHDDMLSDAAYGVTLAIARFNPELGTLKGYAGRRAEGAILHGLRTRASIPRAAWVPGTSVSDYPANMQPAVSIHRDGFIDQGEECRDLKVAEARVTVTALMTVLTDRERHVITQVDLRDRPSVDVAQELGVTGSAIGQTRKVAKAKMAAAGGDDLVLMAA